MGTVQRESIGSIIRTVIEGQTAPVVSASEIAAQVVARIPSDLYRAYLLDLIAGDVSAQVSALRSKVTPVPLRAGRSTKQALIRDQFWPQFLATKVSLPGGYKPLADATADDLLFLAEERRAMAGDLMRRAEQFEHLAGLMRSARVKTLGALSPAVGEKALAA